jgi:DNA gyrase subunit A
VQTLARGAYEKTGVISGARIVQESDDLTIISGAGSVIRTKVKAVPSSGRATRGVLLMSLQGNDSVASLARIADADLRQVGAAE